MDDKNISDDELEEELNKAFKFNEKRKEIFTIMRKEKESLEVKEKRLRDEFKF